MIDPAASGPDGAIVWLTGLSGAGKSTLAEALAASLRAERRFAAVLDGDALRQGLCRGLGFAPADRHENIRRVAEVARLFAGAGAIAIVAFISPYAADRAAARAIAAPHPFLEVHLATPLAVCEQRDPKGLYRRARAGEIRQFTGLDAPYEAPEAPELRIDTSLCPVPEAVRTVCARLAATAGRA